MAKQISVKAVKSTGSSLSSMYKEAQTYLMNIGFSKMPLLALTSKEQTFRSYIFSQGREKVILEYKQDEYEEVLNLVFNETEIRFVYDILLMRFNQLARDEKSVFIYNE
ncbi:TPA: hypothetical protein HA239_01045 [Candidatus Woesearchaeota archaeon]|nr:hypothetical protein QT06_C0001G0248 [archaeon GW2011_AR15]MBS3103953.1 hypothetical protein [Candidatus Woesearchaeota archaeon]HIH40979.1 hypothetical protein [Candidatus Woesearchaeota archaeon]